MSTSAKSFSRLWLCGKAFLGVRGLRLHLSLARYHRRNALLPSDEDPACWPRATIIQGRA